MQSTYDAIPYTSHPFQQAHIDRLATIATLRGMRPAGVATARVLELGCAGGGHLTPMAERLPEARFVGVDASARQVADGQAIIARLGLTNIELRHADILTLGEDLGAFDYVICHGVYSWVPPAVQAKILEICQTRLSPNGVAYVSYNTLPGWRMRGIVRDVMLYRARQLDGRSERLGRARQMVDFLSKAVPGGDKNPYGLLLRQEVENLGRHDDYYLEHEHLEEFNEPLYFHEFAGRAATAGLQFLGEADFGSSSVAQLPPQTRAVVQSVSSDRIETEQYLDFLRNRMFRQTLLCHAETNLDFTVRPERLNGLYVSSPVKPEGEIGVLTSRGPVKFAGPRSVTTTTDPLMKAVLLELGSVWPKVVRINQVLADAVGELSGGPVVINAHGGQALEKIAGSLIACYESGQIELSTLPSSFTTQAEEKPYASALARLQAAEGAEVTNGRHETVRLRDFDRAVLRRLDGTHDVASLSALLAAAAAAGELLLQTNSGADESSATQTIEPLIVPALQRLVQRALLLPPA